MTPQDAKIMARDLIGRMVVAQGSEMLLQTGRLPQIKVANEWCEWNNVPIPAAQLEALASAVTLPDQWIARINTAYMRCEVQLLALGIGRFKIKGESGPNSLSLSISTTQPPVDTSEVPFNPAYPLPALSAQAIVEI